MAKLTIDQRNFVKELAYLAYGTGGKSERTQGGKGNMGLMYAEDGSVHVFKFNTHGSQAAAAQRQVAAGESGDVLTASNALRNELEKLAITAGLKADAIETLLGPNAEGKSLLTRKVVAKFVTGISKSCAEMKDVWDGVTGVKSAGDMAFDKVANPQPDHAKFNRSMKSINAAFDAAVSHLKCHASSLYNSQEPSVGNLAWLHGISEFGGAKQLDAAAFKRAQAELKKIEDRGFGFLMDKDASLAVAIGGVISELHPEFNGDEIALVRVFIEDEVTSGTFDTLAFGEGTFKSLVEGNLKTRLNADDLQTAMRERREVLAALDALKDDLKTFDDLKDDLLIRENIHILTTVANHYDSAMKCLGKYAERDNHSDALLRNVEKRLRLQTLKGAPVALHGKLGTLNLSNGLRIAHSFAGIYKLAKEKGKVHGLLLALKEDGCFSARMGAIQDFVSALEGGDAMGVEHKDGESVEAGLTNELSAVAQEWYAKHPNADPLHPVQPKWSEIKGEFENRMRGKEFAGIVWTPHKIYENITKDILEWATVEADKDFLQNKADVNTVHFAQL